jgi:hypothetical protein
MKSNHFFSRLGSELGSLANLQLENRGVRAKHRKTQNHRYARSWSRNAERDTMLKTMLVLIYVLIPHGRSVSDDDIATLLGKSRNVKVLGCDA